MPKMNLKFTFSAFFAAACVCAALPGPATAQTHKQVADAEVAHARRIMPQIDAWLVRHPNDINALYAKARASVALGLDEEARAAYLRLSAQAPNHPVLRLELATIEHRLRNYEAARESYTRVAAMPNLPIQVSTVLGQRLEQIDKALQRHFFSGSLTLGLRAQENANGGPDDRFVEFWGLDFTMDDASMPQSDETASISGRFGYSYKLNDYGDMLGAQFSAFSLQPSQLDQNQRDGVELRFGPSFNLSHFDMNGSFAIQAVLSKSWIEGQSYMEGHGVQLNFNRVLDPRNRIGLSYGHRQEAYENSEGRRRATDRDGHRNDFGLTWQHMLRPDLMLTASYGREDRNAAVDYRSSVADQLSLGLSKRHASPFAWSEGDWVTSARLSARHFRFDVPDPMMSTTRAERTREISFALNQSIPLQENLSANLGLHLVKARSNYATSEWSDKSIDFSITYSF